MHIKTYLAQPGVDIAALADRAGTKPIYLRQLAWGYRQPSPKLARAIEVATGGRVTRQELRPDVWGPLETLPVSDLGVA